MISGRVEAFDYRSHFLAQDIVDLQAHPASLGKSKPEHGRGIERVGIILGELVRERELISFLEEKPRDRYVDSDRFAFRERYVNQAPFNRIPEPEGFSSEIASLHFHRVGGS